MKVAFFTSTLNHHQLPFCKEMVRVLGENFTLVTTMDLEVQRIILGYEDYSLDYDFCIRMNSSDIAFDKAYKISQECDVLIAGVIPEEFIYDRMKSNKLTFRYSERFFEKGVWRVLKPKNLITTYNNHFRYRNKNIYLLCASAYLPNDANSIFSYPNKMFKWGYFPEYSEENLDDLIIKKKKVIEILWVGRFKKLKRPWHALMAAKHLDNVGINYVLEFIGTGPIFDEIVKLSKDFSLKGEVIFLGPLTPENVRKKMNKSDIFLFTSNKREGWGVVLNEAMNSGCVVIANKNIGSVPYLITHNKNGFIYKDGNLNDFYKILEKVCLDTNLRSQIAKEAFLTIKNHWNSEIAVKRLVQQIDNLLSGKKLINYKDGPLALAKKMK